MSAKELNIGDYVRTEEGIKKIVKYDYDERLENGHGLWFENENYGISYTDEEIKELKPSPNIIDLIEEGDYVNGHKVLEVNSSNVSIESNAIENEIWEEIEDYEIKSIVTKEQFESMEYKIGE